MNAVVVFAPVGAPDDDDDPLVRTRWMADRMGADGPALDADNSALLHNRWGHAIACHAGTELAARACQAGAVCFAGYDTALHVDWHPDTLSDELLPLLARLVTETSRRLATREFDHQALQRAVNGIADEIEAWCESQPDDAPEQMLVITAQQFVQRLVVRCRAAESS